jgi:hypothetical protein
MTTETISTNYANYNNYVDYQSGNHEAENAWWGSAGSAANEYFTLNTSTFPDGTTFNWNWPTVSASTWSPQAYPDEIYVNQWATGTENGAGRSPGSLYANEVPTSLSNISALTATYNVSLSGNITSTDVLFDIWLTAPGSHNLNWTTVGPETEIEIFVHSPTAFGNTSGTFTAGGIVGGNVTVGSNTNGSVTWQTVGITTPSDMLSGTLDINAIFQTLIADCIINSSEQVSDIRLGSEVSGGAGSLTINDFSVNWQNSTSTTPPPPPPTVSPSGTIVLNNSGGTITDSSFNLWTITNGVIDENGAAAGHTGHATEIAYVNSVIYEENTSDHWYDWTGKAWASTTDPFATHHH